MTNGSTPAPELSATKKALLAIEELETRLADAEARAREPIAIVGLSCRLPGGVTDAESYWELLHSGGDAITRVPPDRFDVDAYFDPDPDAAGTLSTVWGGFLPDVDRFDAGFFGISAREADAIDPQHKVLLEVAHEALEDAGLAPGEPGVHRTGVFMGLSTADYLQHLSRLPLEQTDAYMATGNSFALAAGRISHALGLTGPSLTLDTACSSSLVALHLAVQSLRNRECDAALAGGVNIILNPFASISLSKARMMAPDGRCKSFDAAADGYVRSEGCGVVVLKRLADARADGDRVLAVVRGSAVMHDGHSAGLTVPNGDAQANLITAAQANAGVLPDEVDVIEAHGSGTALGDPIEMNALKAVFGWDEGKRPLFVSSVKANLGHLEAAAGVAALIKVVLVLRKRLVPPLVHFKTLNPSIDLAHSRITIPQSPTQWPSELRPRRAGLSSFGFGGTIAHAVLEEAAPMDVPRFDKPRVAVLTITAKTRTALQSLTARYKDFAAETSSSILDVAFSAATGRHHHSHRIALVCDGDSDLGRLAQTAAVRARSEAPPPAGRAKIAFLFGGQGDHYPTVARELFKNSRPFRRDLEICDQFLREQCEVPLLDILERAWASGRSDTLDQSGHLQEVVFSLQYALARLFIGFDVRPNAVMGQSLGEYVAATIAGVISLPDALALVAARSRMTSQIAETGAMATVLAASRDVEDWLHCTSFVLSVAAINGPQSTIVAGSCAEIDAAIEALNASGLPARRLPIPYASHTALMDDVLDPFEKTARDFRFETPQLALVSTTTGALHRSIDAAHWRRHLREPVLFSQGLKALAAIRCNVFVDLSLSGSLSSLGRQTLSEGLWVRALDQERADTRQIMDGVAALYERGVDLNWRSVFSPFAPAKVALPTYPFERKRSWIDVADRHSDVPVSQQSTVAVNATSGGKDLAFELVWRPLGPFSPERLRKRGVWLVLAESEAQVRTFGERLCAAGDEFVVTTPQPASIGKKKDAELAPHYDWDVIDRGLDCARDRGPLAGVVHMWGLSEDRTPDSLAYELQQELLCQSALRLVKALADTAAKDAPELFLVTRGAQAVGEAKHRVCASQATLWGLGRVIASEQPALSCRLVDLDPEGDDHANLHGLADLITAQTRDNEIALRDGKAYSPRLMRCPDQLERKLPSVEEGDALSLTGTYLVAGGLGELGLTLARWLVGKGARALALISRGAPDDASRGEMAALAKKGVRVEAYACDIADENSLSLVIDAIEAEMPPLAGVVHAAGVVDDGALHRLNWQRFRAVLHSKVWGARNLDRLTSGRDLKLFLCCSSAAALLGPPGQGSYAAANAYLDALVHDRRARGLAGQSINFGPWAGIGMAARIPPAHRARQEAHGISFMAPASAIAMLDRAIVEDVGQRMICQFDTRPLQQLDGFSAPPLVEEIADGRGEISTDPVVALLLDGLAAAPYDGRVALLIAYLKHVLAKTLRADADELETDRHLMEYGLDSIMVMMLAQRLEVDLDVAVTAAALFSCTTVASMAAYLIDLLPSQRSSRIEEGKSHSTGSGDLRSEPHALAATKELTGQAGEMSHVAVRGRADDRVRNPLTASQRADWETTQRQPNSNRLTVRQAIRLRGKVDYPALEVSINALVQRHDSLRSAFVQELGKPVQVVEPFAFVPLVRRDVSGEAPEQRDAAVFGVAEDLIREPFDLARAPLVRCVSVKLEDDLCVLIFAIHHMVVDAWSYGVLLDELALLYDAAPSARSSALALDLPQYRDFAEWQNQLESSEEGKTHRSFWRKVLQDAPDAPRLPTDRPRKAEIVSSSAEHSVSLGDDQHSRLILYTRTEGITVSAAMLTALTIFVAQHTDTRDCILGVVAANRNVPRLAKVVGSCATSLPFRLHLPANSTFRSVARDAQEMLKLCLVHQAYPIDRVHTAPDGQATPAPKPYATVLFNYVEPREKTTEFRDLEMSRAGMSDMQSSAEFALIVWGRDDGARLSFVTHEALFDDDRVAQFADSYLTILTAGLSAPDHLLFPEPRPNRPDFMPPELCGDSRGPIATIARPFDSARHKARGERT
ncbi:MAG: SDR family oxidoreductase [Pseudomonadota bacterium]